MQNIYINNYYVHLDELIYVTLEYMYNVIFNFHPILLINLLYFHINNF